jgi:hypothetical protein
VVLFDYAYEVLYLVFKLVDRHERIPFAGSRQLISNQVELKLSDGFDGHWRSSAIIQIVAAAHESLLRLVMIFQRGTKELPMQREEWNRADHFGSYSFIILFG